MSHPLAPKVWDTAFFCPNVCSETYSSFADVGGFWGISSYILHFTLVSVATGRYYFQEVVDSVDSVLYIPEVVNMMFPISYLVYSVDRFTI